MPRANPIGACLALTTALAGFAWAQPSPGPEAPLADVDQILKQAHKEIGDFERGGGKKDDARHPVAGWVEKLWAFRRSHPGTPAAGQATAEAIHLLVHADRVPDAEAKADGLEPDDPAWESLARVLFEAATVKKDYAFLIRKLGAMVTLQRDAKVRGALHYQLGNGQAKAGEAEAARASFKAAIEEAAGTPLAQEAQAALYQLDNLGYGQAAPLFASKARDGSRIALADFRDRVVLLVFWAST